MGITRDGLTKRRKTGGKRVRYMKKRKFAMGRPSSMTKLSKPRIRTIRCRYGIFKKRALRLDSGCYGWGSEGIVRKTRILSVVYNPTNNEFVRTNTLVKGEIVQVDATPFKLWYEQYYGVAIGNKISETVKRSIESKKLANKLKKTVGTKRGALLAKKAAAAEAKNSKKRRSSTKSGGSTKKTDSIKKPAATTGDAKKPAAAPAKKAAAKSAAAPAKKTAAKDAKTTAAKPASAGAKGPAKTIAKKTEGKSAAKGAAPAKKGAKAVKGGKLEAKLSTGPIAAKHTKAIAGAASGTLTGTVVDQSASQLVRNKHAKRAKKRVLEPIFEEQFASGRLLACIQSRPGQVGAADGYLLEGRELEFYLKKTTKNRKAK